MMASQSTRQTDLTYFDDVCRVIRRALQLSDDVSLATDTLLLGAIAEFDSMSVVTVLTELEQQFGFFADDDEISAETFESIGTLLEFVQAKTGS